MNLKKITKIALVFGALQGVCMTSPALACNDIVWGCKDYCRCGKKIGSSPSGSKTTTSTLSYSAVSKQASNSSTFSTGSSTGDFIATTAAGGLAYAATRIPGVGMGVSAVTAVAQDITRKQRETFQQYKSDIDRGKISGVQMSITTNSHKTTYPSATVSYKTIPRKG